MSEEIGFAILGRGRAAEHHAAAIQTSADQGAVLRAVGVPNWTLRTAETEARFGVPCRSIEELLSDERVQIICICSPSGDHFSQTLAAAAAGKHVLVEKPMALSLEQADAMRAACETAGVHLAVCFQLRGHPVYARVTEAIRQGRLGRIISGSFFLPYVRGPEYFKGAAWRGTLEHDGGGVLMNQALHFLDWWVWTRGVPRHVEARIATTFHSIEVEDTLAAILEMQDGGLIGFQASTAAMPGAKRRIDLIGSEGTLVIEDDEVRQAPEAVQSILGRHSTPTSGHAPMVRNMIGALERGEAILADGESSRTTLKVALRIYSAAGRK
jgi:UDP-N-acetyl-2-amino-2-deoxyglucuronate dehydrogenase